MGGFVARGRLPVGAGLNHLLRGLLGVLLVGRGEVVDGILHHVPGIYGLLQTAGNALHGRDGLYGNSDTEQGQRYLNVC